MYKLIIISFFFSGMCGLIYEVLWTRMLGLVFGATVYAVCSVLSSYMAGLALGSFLFGRYADRQKNPIRIYAFLEAGIGVTALLVPVVFGLLEKVYGVFYGPLHADFYIFSVVRLIISFLVLLIPTSLMGATLPVLSRYFVRESEKTGAGTGILYGINTLGAVLGCFIAGFLLVEKIGIKNTSLIAGAVNLSIASIMFIVSCRKGGFEGVSAGNAGKLITPNIVSENTGKTAIAIFAVSGFCSLSYEVLWSRIMVFFFTSNTYAFSMMLVTFLMGISLGSIIFTKISDRSKKPLLILGMIEVFIGILSIVSILLFGKINSIIVNPGGGWLNWLFLRFMACFLIILPPAILMGGAFPVVSRIYGRAGGLKDIGKSIGNVYSLNTLGGILGSLLTGFVLIPLIGIQRSIMLVGIVNILTGCIAVALSPSSKKSAKIIIIMPVIAAAAALVVFVPSGKPLMLNSVIVQKAKTPASILFYREDVTATITVVDVDNDRKLNIDGFNAAGTDKYEYMRMMGHLPVLLCKNPQKALVICFGTGTTCASVYSHGLSELDCVEISPAVVKAGTYYTDVNNGILTKGRFKMIIDDGRNYLLYSNKRYDVITIEPMHPYLSHAVDFYSKEFYELCRKSLNDGGVMCQWAPMHALSGDDYRMILGTFKKVFPHATLWFVGSEGILIGTKEKLTVDFRAVEHSINKVDVKNDLNKIGYDNIYALLDSLVMDENAMDKYIGKSRVITDDMPFIEFSAPRNLILTPDKTWVENLKEINGYRNNAYELLVNVAEKITNSVKKEIARYYESTGHVINGQVFLSAQELEPAYAEFIKASEVNPQDKRITPLVKTIGDSLKYYYFKLGDEYSMSGMLDSAITAYRAALKIAPDYAMAYNGLAIVYNRMGLYEKSIQECRKAIELAPDVPDAYNNLAIIYMNKKLLDKAEENFKKAISTDYNFAKAHYFLGNLYEIKGMLGKAKEKYMETLKIDPAFMRAREALKKFTR